MQYFATTFMNWSELIENLVRDFRLSEPELAQRTGITYPTITRIRSGKTKKPTQSVIKAIENGLKIKINDSDPKNLTYKLISEIKEDASREATIQLNNYPLISNIYAGSSMALFVSENITEYVNLPYDKKERCFALRVHGDSMNHKIEQGDIVLADMDKEVINGCIVVCRLKDGRQIIKRYREIEGNVAMFYSDNGNYEPLTIQKSEIEAIFRIVGIWKKL